MGLDSVELVMEMEEAFGVELKDDEVVKTVTPRMVGDVIFSKLQATDERICQTQRAFHIIRRAFRQLFVLQRKSMTPDMEFRKLIPRPKEKEIWPQIQSAVAARSWPELVRPEWMSRLITAVGFAIFVAIIYAVAQTSLGITLGIFAGIVITVVFGIIAAKITRPFQVYIPSRYKRIRDMVPYAVTSDYVRWTREQVSDLVKQLVMEQLGIHESKYTEDSRFVEDLGMD